MTFAAKVAPPPIPVLVWVFDAFTGADITVDCPGAAIFLLSEANSCLTAELLPPLVGCCWTFLVVGTFDEEPPLAGTDAAAAAAAAVLVVALIEDTG
jgi:hypothetical protein